MKKFVFFLLFVSISALSIAQGIQLKNFKEVMDALNTGEHVRMVAHYAKCQLIVNNQVQESSPNAIGGMDIDVYEYFAPMVFGNKLAFVVFSANKLIKNPKGDKYVINYVKVKVQEDNKATITAEYINPKNYKTTMSETFTSEVNNAENTGGVYFYKAK